MNHLEEHKVIILLERIMAAIDNLTVNVAKLSTDVDTLLAKPAGVPEAQVQAAADAVAAVDAKIVAAIGQ